MQTAEIKIRPKKVNLENNDSELRFEEKDFELDSICGDFIVFCDLLVTVPIWDGEYEETLQSKDKNEGKTDIYITRITVQSLNNGDFYDVDNIEELIKESLIIEK